jgi:hypothetical protein
MLMRFRRLRDAACLAGGDEVFDLPQREPHAADDRRSQEPSQRATADARSRAVYSAAALIAMGLRPAAGGPSCGCGLHDARIGIT